MEEQNVIVCENLTHYYGKRCIYENMNFTVPKGRILGLLGKNGTGKTTTINILNGYLKPRSGNCFLFGENVRLLTPETRRRIALLIEGHVQYAFMNIEQIERFYSKFYPRWNRDAYYDLMSRLKVAPKQKIAKMSCGQRSQVALGLILAQDADLLILDDFSLGLDPGYRRLFTDYLREYAKNEGKTVFITSHIIQDLERLIDDCIILDYGRILVQKPIRELMNSFRRFSFSMEQDVDFSEFTELINTEKVRNKVETYSFLSEDELLSLLSRHNLKVQDLREEFLSLEDVFIGLTGKY